MFARAGVYKAARVNSNPTILGGDSRRLTLGFAPHTYVNFTSIFVDRTSCLHRCFRCVYITANNKSYQESSWITDIQEKILIEAVSAVRKLISVICNDIGSRLGATILSPALMGSAGILNSGTKGLTLSSDQNMSFIGVSQHPRINCARDLGRYKQCTCISTFDKYTIHVR